MNCARTWLAQLAALSAEDLRLLSRLAEALASADRGKADTARHMLDALPAPADADDARARLRAVVAYLE